MGLIKAGIGAVGGVLADQWKEFFTCDALPSDVLMRKGEKTVSGRSSNTKGSDNVITNGSGIVVADGQAMIIVDRGRVVEFCAEPGQFTYDTSSEPSVFTGSLGKSIVDTFETIAKRFAYGGDTGKDQRVYYFNTKEILGNKFGTKSPVPFRVVINEQMGLALSVDIRCNGMYSYTIADPILFYTNVASNVAYEYTRDMIDETLKSEMLNALQPALAKLSAAGIKYYEIPGKTMEIRDALNEVLSSEWGEIRGIKVRNVSINSLTVPDEQKQKITEWEENAMTTNPMIAGSRLVGAQADAMRTAAANEGGSMAGFMGMGMAMNAGGNNAAGFYQMGQSQPQAAPSASASDTWTCACGAANTGKFCTECGSKKPDADGWVCSCGAVNRGKFCSECGSKKPAGVPQYKCDKCGWVPEDPAKAPKFCPECGDPFDNGDIV